MPEPCFHGWDVVKDVDPQVEEVVLDPVQVTDIISVGRALELADEGVLDFESLPLYAGHDEARVWTRDMVFRRTKKTRKWMRTCVMCGESQTTTRSEMIEVPIFEK